MDIKEFFYVDSQGQTIGPVAFNTQNIKLISLDTYVWHSAMTDGWKQASMVPEFVGMIERFNRPPKVVPPKFVPPGSTSGSAQQSSEQKKAPKYSGKVTSSNPSSDNGQKEKARIILLVVTIIGVMLAAAFSFIFIAPIASLFNAKPLNVGFVIGGVVYLLAMVFRLILRKNKGFGFIPLCGLIVGAVFPLIAYARFDDWGTYKSGILRGENVYNSWGVEIYPGHSGVNIVTGVNGIKILVVSRNEVKDGYYYTASGYDENGILLYNETTPEFYGDSYDCNREYTNYLREEVGIIVDGISLNVN